MAARLPPDSPGRVCADGLVLKLRVTPGAKRDAIGETRVWGKDVRLLVRVRADAQDGKANAAVCRLIAEWLDWPLHDVRLVAGERSRPKTVVAHGEPDALFGRLAAVMDRL